LLSSCNWGKKEKLTVAISPYQDIAMIVNIKNLELEKKYNTEVDLQTMNWEDIVPAVASSGKTVDIGFGSLVEYLTKENNINKDTKDPLLFIYPAYIYKGGGFISFNKNVPVLNSANISNDSLVKSFLQNKIGAQKNSLYEMLLFNLARKNSVPYKDLKIFDSPMNDGLLATQNGSLDISSAGLTQITEALKQNGRVVLSMDDMGFADVTGFICKKSVLEKKRTEIENLMKMWFECVSYVMQDIDNNSKFSLKYLDEKAATKYTLEQYKTALSQEYFPLTIDEAGKEIISATGKFSYQRISDDVSEYLTANKIVETKPITPQFIELTGN
jgi:ABC-type nitrate/sulfonate/bicarbonate transport system substrate-binding protein